MAGALVSRTESPQLRVYGTVQRDAGCLCRMFEDGIGDACEVVEELLGDLDGDNNIDGDDRNILRAALRSPDRAPRRGA